MVRSSILGLAVVSVLQLAQAGSAQAQTTTAAESTGIEEVVVTARRREENLQNVPTAVSALGADELADLQINNFSEIGLTVPNLSVQTQFGSVRSPSTRCVVRTAGR